MTSRAGLSAATGEQEAAPASRLGLSRQRIVDAALTLLDREGLDAFSMRRLADELGVGTMTIYGYFRRKDELLDAVVDIGADQITAAGTAAGPWKVRLRELMLGIRQSLAEHPGIVELRFRRPLVSPGALRLTETGMRILLEAGFSKREAARAYRALFIYVFGFSAFGPRRAGEERAKTLEALNALPADRFPALTGAASEASEAMADQTVFEFGLDRLLDGFDSHARSSL